MISPSRVIEGKELVDRLRIAIDASKERLWISSPFIGGWPRSVRRIMGTKWQSKVGDIRLLTDVEAGAYRLNTMQQFLRRGRVKSLLGLHGKIYIADDVVLLTSANLTGTAFSKRYESGIFLAGQPARDAVALFKSWWRQGKSVHEEHLKDKRRTKNGDPGDPDGNVLVQRTPLPPDAKDASLPSDTFGDYDTFLECFQNLASIYKKSPRAWLKSELYFELDGFLNFLYWHAPGRPSRKYSRKRPETLSDAQRRAKIAKYATAFRHACTGDSQSADSSTWRTDSSRSVRRLLKKNVLHGLTRSEIKDLLRYTNSMSSYALNIRKVVNPRNNKLEEIRETLRELVNEERPIQPRMADCSRRVFGLGSSTIQELVGFYYPGKYPLRNKNTNCGLRFFGYEVRVR